MKTMVVSIYSLKKICLITFLLIGLFNPASGQTMITLEAEAATLLGTADVVNCNSASGGKMVRDIGNGVANGVKFQNIDLSEAGGYFITVSYFSTNDREITYQLNDGDAMTKSIPSSGLWCYQGGAPADYTFEENFVAGSNSLLFYNSPLIDKIVISSDTSARQPDVFYISASSGDDNEDGLSPATAWQTLSTLNALSLEPGDSLLFKAGDTFIGELTFLSEGGTVERPITVGKFGTGNKPILNGNGYLSAIHIRNSGHLYFSDLEIVNDGGQPQPGEPTNLRYGLYLENTYSDGTIYEGYRFNNLTFKNIYPTDQITDNDQTGTHAYAFNTSGSWGDEVNPTRFNDVRIENCFFTRTGRHALRIVATNDLHIKNNLFEHVGGAGMVIGANSSNILVEYNTTNYTGSNIDSRMAGRGSGIWAFRIKNLTVQHNKFMHARGIKDSFGMHIDIGNTNVVYQYNYSEDNEGGFVEILGANVNVGYRYNLSVGDGWRSRGGQLGRIFWVGGWSGNPANPIGSDSVFIYNNSVYVRDTIAPRIWIEAVTQQTKIYNNIIYVSNTFGEVFIKNDPSLNDFDHNIWYGTISSTDSDGQPYRGANALTSNPLFSTQIVTDSSGFVLQTASPAIGAGKLINNSGITQPYDYFYNNGGKDYYGNSVSSSSAPNIGAYNGPGGIVNNSKVVFQQPLQLFPNPVQAGQPVVIEIPSHVNTRSLSLQVIEMSGKILLEKSYPRQHHIRLETSGLAQGSYLIKIKAADYQMTEQVLIF